MLNSGVSLARGFQSWVRLAANEASSCTTLSTLLLSFLLPLLHALQFPPLLTSSFHVDVVNRLLRRDFLSAVVDSSLMHFI